MPPAHSYISESISPWPSKLKRFLRDIKHFQDLFDKFFAFHHILDGIQSSGRNSFIGKLDSLICAVYKADDQKEAAALPFYFDTFLQLGQRNLLQKVDHLLHFFAGNGCGYAHEADILCAFKVGIGEHIVIYRFGFYLLFGTAKQGYGQQNTHKNQKMFFHSKHRP